MRNKREISRGEVYRRVCYSKFYEIVLKICYDQYAMVGDNQLSCERGKNNKGDTESCLKKNGRVQ